MEITIYRNHCGVSIEGSSKRLQMPSTPSWRPTLIHNLRLVPNMKWNIIWIALWTVWPTFCSNKMATKWQSIISSGLKEINKKIKSSIWAVNRLQESERVDKCPWGPILMWISALTPHLLSPFWINFYKRSIQFTHCLLCWSWSIGHSPMAHFTSFVFKTVTYLQPTSACSTPTPSLSSGRPTFLTTSLTCHCSTNSSTVSFASSFPQVSLTFTTCSEITHLCNWSNLWRCSWILYTKIVYISWSIIEMEVGTQGCWEWFLKVIWKCLFLPSSQPKLSCGLICSTTHQSVKTHSIKNHISMESTYESLHTEDCPR